MTDNYSIPVGAVGLVHVDMISSDTELASFVMPELDCDILCGAPFMVTYMTLAFNLA